MTDLRATNTTSGIVRRRTVEAYDYKGRRLIVAMYPGDVIGIREENTRKEFIAPIGRIYQAMIRWTVETERANNHKR